MDRWYQDHVLATRKMKEQQDAAQRYRLALMQNGLIPPKMRFYRRWLADLGSLLIIWGTRLQHRYEDMVASQSVVGFNETKVKPC